MKRRTETWLTRIVLAAGLLLAAKELRRLAPAKR